MGISHKRDVDLLKRGQLYYNTQKTNTEIKRILAEQTFYYM